MLEKNPDHCQLATTSECPEICSGPFNDNNVQSLDPNAACSVGQWNGGCHIKEGWSLDIFCIILINVSDKIFDFWLIKIIVICLKIDLTRKYLYYTRQIRLCVDYYVSAAS